MFHIEVVPEIRFALESICPATDGHRPDGKTLERPADLDVEPVRPFLQSLDPVTLPPYVSLFPTTELTSNRGRSRMNNGLNSLSETADGPDASIICKLLKANWG